MVVEERCEEWAELERCKKLIQVLRADELEGSASLVDESPRILHVVRPGVTHSPGKEKPR